MRIGSCIGFVVVMSCAASCWAEDEVLATIVQGTYPDGRQVMIQLPGEAQPRPFVASDRIVSGTRVISTEAVVQMRIGTQGLLAFQANGSVRVLMEEGKVVLEIPENVKLRLATFATTPKGMVVVRPRKGVLCELEPGTDFVVDSIGETVVGGATVARWEAGPDGLEAGSQRVEKPKYFPWPVGKKRQEPQDVAKVEIEKLTSELPLRHGDRIVSTPLREPIQVRAYNPVTAGGFGKPGIDPPKPPPDITP